LLAIGTLEVEEVFLSILALLLVLDLVAIGDVRMSAARICSAGLRNLLC
jgi:hypothetical protein